MVSFRVLMVSSEVESLARTGGLGDAVHGLARALAHLGHDVAIVTPLYGITRVPADVSRTELDVALGGERHRVGIVVKQAHPKLRFVLVDAPALFARAGIYGDASGGFGDNDRRFALLSKVGAELGPHLWGGEDADVLHAHDWHAALSVLYAKQAARPLATVFTIHNLAFQGVFEGARAASLGLDARYQEAIAHDRDMNWVKGAILEADRVTTVSPTYAREILTEAHGFGLDPVLRAQESKLLGILNGIDVDAFDPKSDPALHERYDVDSYAHGKRACKEALTSECGLDGHVPLFGCVARLAWQKGIDVLTELVPRLSEQAAILFLGQGEPELEARLRGLAHAHPTRVATRLAFDETLARRIYAGSDFFLVPSRFEPCGLTQMYAMRYGSLPIVTATGGLKDTVPDVDASPDGTGFVAPHATAPDLENAIARALALDENRPRMTLAVERAMRRDFSWIRSAAEFVDLYRKLRET